MLPHPLVVCPESIRKFHQGIGTGLGQQVVSSKNSFIDDNFMYAAAHVIALRAVHPHGEICIEIIVMCSLLFRSGY